MLYEYVFLIMIILGLSAGHMVTLRLAASRKAGQKEQPEVYALGSSGTPCCNNGTVWRLYDHFLPFVFFGGGWGWFQNEKRARLFVGGAVNNIYLCCIHAWMEGRCGPILATTVHVFFLFDCWQLSFFSPSHSSYMRGCACVALFTLLAVSPLQRCNRHCVTVVVVLLILLFWYHSLLVSLWYIV